MLACESMACKVNLLQQQPELSANEQDRSIQHVVGRIGIAVDMYVHYYSNVNDKPRLQQQLSFRCEYCGFEHDCRDEESIEFRRSVSPKSKK